MDIVKDIRQDLPGTGTRKLIYLLKENYGIRYGRDKLFALLDRENLLIRQRHRKPRTTWSGHPFPVYPNLVKDIVPMRPNEVWVSDITYIKTVEGFKYLFLITDMYSRKIVGWSLAADMRAEHALEALRMALAQKGDGGLSTIHHSDRGTQYCCSDYVAALKADSIKISMTEKGDPRENAYAERINGTIKNEFLKHISCAPDEFQTAVCNSIQAYNVLRPHASIDYMTPEEAHARSGEIKRRWKHYPWYHKDNQKENVTFAAATNQG